MTARKVLLWVLLAAPSTKLLAQSPSAPAGESPAQGAAQASLQPSAAQLPASSPPAPAAPQQPGQWHPAPAGSLPQNTAAPILPNQTPDDLPVQLLGVKRIFVDRLTGGETAAQMRDLLIGSLQGSRLFILTENADRADAFLRGAAEDLIYTDAFQSSEGINARAGGSENGSEGGLPGGRSGLQLRGERKDFRADAV